MDLLAANAAHSAADPACRKYTSSELGPYAGPAPAAARVRFTPKGSLEVAEELWRAGADPCVLNFANNASGWVTGCQGTTQEEVLMKRTTLSAGLRAADPYPLDDVQDLGRAWAYGTLGLAYSPRVHVVRDALYRPLAGGPYPRVAVVTCAAIRCPLVRGGRYASAADRDVTRRKIGMILDAAMANGHGVVVAGEWGCGAFANPVAEVASLWVAAARARPVSVVFPVFTEAFGRAMTAALAAPSEN